MKPQLKPLFTKRMQELLGKGKEFESYIKILEKEPVKSIRCNTLKISPKELKEKLKQKNWKIKQPFDKHPEIMIVKNKLQPGELGRTLEHLLGYYYIQELASMLPIIVLNPKPNEIFLDLCAAPGSKTTQAAANMENTGTIIANDVNIGRIKILASNLERCGVTNTIITRKDGFSLCKRLKRQANEGGVSVRENIGYLKGGVSVRGTLVPLKVDKILVDAPCSGEGTLRSSPKTYKMWNIKSVKNLSKIQKNLVANTIELLKPNGELVYSTCTHAPEENEEVVDFILKKFKDIKIEKISLPIKSQAGIKKWQDKEYLEDVKYSCRIYPHEADTEGFFITKFRRVG